MFGKLSHEEIEQVLQDQHVGHIGCHADGMTYVVPINYTYDGTSIYCFTQEGLKIKLMRKNPQVCFQVEAIQQPGNWKSVITWGQFEELQEHTIRGVAVEKLLSHSFMMNSSERAHLSAEWPFTNGTTELVQGILFRIKLSEKTGRFEQSSQSIMVG